MSWYRTPCLAAALLSLLGPAAVVRAQEPSPELPDSAAERAISAYNAADIRMVGASDIAIGTTLEGSIAVLDGPLRVSGTVQGSVTVINGDLELLSGALITGSALVVGGTVSGDTAAVQGGVVAYPEPLRYRFEGPGIARARRPVRAVISAGRDFAFGRTDFLAAVHGGYNRVEGLPIVLGPRARLGHSNPTVLEAQAIIRTEKPLDYERYGWSLRAEQYLGGRRAVSFGVRARSEIVAIESWMLSDLENSLATFLLHQDYRDHYRRQGWSIYLRAHHPQRPIDAMLEYRDERHRSVRAASPLSLIDNGKDWRHEPVIEEGTLRSLTLSLAYDTRNDENDPSAGWYVRGAVEQAINGDLSLTPEAGAVLGADSTDNHFTHLEVDARRYLRFSPWARLALRVFTAGSLDGDALPAQRQHALGGEGSLPGFPLFAQDCGARTQTIERNGDGAYPFYGCDRLALVQLEYQASFPFAGRLGDQLGLDLDLARAVRWSLFFDAGRAWIEGDARAGRSRGADDFFADTGLGIRIGPLGLYGAIPISGRGHDFNFFVRIGQRF
ncbi:MAG TPA: BamA/TamA family outer membrane protein [Longimicrobiales bacterium]|nr:BamA/TamA family outer membrane protein [Longimicrobiales bacterium]